jgi:glucose/arabinose dehydrogenase
VETVLEGLNEPVAMAFDPSGRIFYIERPGAVRVAAGGVVRPEPVIALPTDTCSERGMVGLALDPHFASNAYIYVHHTELSDCKETRGKVVRFTENASAGAAPETIFSALYSGEQHTGGAINFGPDGMLYITTGDDHNADTPQNLSIPQGKMHRVNPDGSIPTGNPTFSQAGALASIYAYGLRNTFDFTFDPIARGRIWASENGPHCDDEVNRIEAGYNYGWRAGYLCDDPAPGGPDPQYNTIPPLWYLPESACCIGPTGIEVYRGAAIPEWTNELFMCSYNEGMMLHFHLNEARTEATGVARVEGVTCTMDVVTGPDGALYYIEGGGGRPGSIKRIVGSR